MQKRILIIDIETTGFLQKGGTIVEVGMIELDLETGKKEIVFDSVCHEEGITREQVESSWIVANSDLTVEDVRTSPKLKDLIPMIQTIVDQYPLGMTAFNRDFDEKFLTSRGIVFGELLPCPMLISTDICKLPSPRGRGFKWPKVEEAYAFFFPERDYVEKHRGADDAMHEADIVYELYKRGSFLTT